MTNMRDPTDRRDHAGAPFSAPQSKSAEDFASSSPLTLGEEDVAVAAPARTRWLLSGSIVLLLVLAAGWYFWSKRDPAPPNTSAAAGNGGNNGPGKRGGLDPANRPMPVGASVVRTADLPVRLTALGTVIARNTVTVRSRVDGQLMQITFREGDTVRAGQLLALIDPRSFEVALAQANGQLERDRAQLANARNDLARYRGLLATDSIAAQQVDNQEALVKQDEAIVLGDQAAVDSAKLQLSFTRVTSPVTGRAGLRQIDPGNQVHASDATGIVVVTEVQPISVVFPLPQDNLPTVLARLRTGAVLPVEAFDREGRLRLASGHLVTVDNQVDPTTGTVKLKAEFDNRDLALFPNQFVNIKLLVDTQAGATVVPAASVQRGAPGTYVYVVRDDSTVTVRTVKLGPADGDNVAINDGVTVGERVVVDGVDRLREGARVDVIDRAASGNVAGAGGNANDAKSAAGGGEKKSGSRRQRNGDGAQGDAKVGTKSDSNAPAPVSTVPAAANAAPADAKQ